MVEHGRSTLSTDESGRIVDRLAGLEKVISPELVRQVLRDTGRVNGRACRLTHEVMLWVVLAMGLLTHIAIRQVFRHARRLHRDEYAPGRSSLCEARQRLGVEPLRALHARVVRPLSTPETPGAFYRGLRLMAIDGTVMDVPDSAANAVFGRASGGRGDGAFPQVRKVSLVELGTHIETAIAIGGWCDSEQELARQLWEHVPADALLLEDRGFFSYDAWKVLHFRIKLLVRVKSHMVLKPMRRLADGSYLAKIYPASYYRDKDQHGIVVRVIEYTLDDPRRTGHGEAHRFITNLLDETEYPALELIVLYHERWEEEWAFRIAKDELSIRPIWHQIEDRVKSHILVCFLAYVLWKTLAGWMRLSGLGDAPRTVLDELSKLKSGDVTLQARSPRDGGAAADRKITLRCVTEPDAAQRTLLHRLGLNLPRRLRRLDGVTQM